MPRTPFSECAKAVMRTEQKTGQEAAGTVSARVPANQPNNYIFKQFHMRQRIDLSAIRRHIERVIIQQIKHHYEWYAAYRILMDLKLLEETRLSKFAAQMQDWFPDASIPCTRDALGDYAVGHTSKAFTLWDRDAFLCEKRNNQSLSGFITLFHRCEELRALLFPLPLIEMGLPY